MALCTAQRSLCRFSSVASSGECDYTVVLYWWPAAAYTAAAWRLYFRPVRFLSFAETNTITGNDGV